MDVIFVVISILSLGLNAFNLWILKGIYNSLRNVEDSYIDVNLQTLLRDEEVK